MENKVEKETAGRRCIFLARDAVQIKGTKSGLIIMLDPTVEFEVLKNSLKLKMEASRGFFEGAKFTVRQRYHKSMESHQRAEIEDICLQYGLIPSPAGDSPPIEQGSNGPKPSRPGGETMGVLLEPAKLVRRMLRSGYLVTSPDHIVIAGDLNPGARVVAGGSVVVMGSCRGEVQAGVGGNKRAVVVALRMLPSRLSIAGVQAAPELLSAVKEQRPAVARLVKGKILVGPYHV